MVRGRHPPACGIRNSSVEGHSGRFSCVGESRIQSEPIKVSTLSKSTCGVPGNGHRSEASQGETPSLETVYPETFHQKGFGYQDDVSSQPGIIGRQHQRHAEGSDGTLEPVETSHEGSRLSFSASWVEWVLRNVNYSNGSSPDRPELNTTSFSNRPADEFGTLDSGSGLVLGAMGCTTSTSRWDSSENCTRQMEFDGTGDAYHPQGSDDPNESSPTTSAAARKLPPPGEVGQLDCRLGLEEGVCCLGSASQAPCISHFTLHARDKAVNTVRARAPEFVPRLSVEALVGEERCGIDQPGLQNCVQHAAVSSQRGRLRRRTQRQMREVLVVAPSSKIRGRRRLRPTLEQDRPETLAQPALASDCPGHSKAATGASSTGSPSDTDLDLCPMVGGSIGDHIEVCGSQRMPISTSGDFDPPASSLEDPCEPGVVFSLDNVTVLRDIPLASRLKWAESLPENADKIRTIRALKAERNAASNTSFFDVKPVFQHAANEFVIASRMVPVCEVKLRLATLILLRLTTFMRSTDAASIVPGLFTCQGQFIIRFVAKGNHRRGLVVRGWPLWALCSYLCLLRFFPRKTLFLSLPGRGGKRSGTLGSERLAKLVLNCLKQLGVDIQTWKSHSLRGAAATQAIIAGIPPTVVQHQGGWRSRETFEFYYARANQFVLWDSVFEPERDLLQGAFVTHSENPQKTSTPLTTKEVIRGEVEGRFSECVNILRDSGLVLDLSSLTH